MGDGEMIRDLSAQYLPKLGCEAELAIDGSEASPSIDVRGMKAAPFRAVLPDLTVPAIMGAFETRAELRKLDPSVIAVACSGYTTDPAIVGCKRYGFAHPLIEPYRPDERARVLHHALQQIE